MVGKNELIILLGGGTKKSQDKDIKIAKLRWNNYKTTQKKKKTYGSYKKI